MPAARITNAGTTIGAIQAQTVPGVAGLQPVFINVSATGVVGSDIIVIDDIPDEGIIIDHVRHRVNTGSGTGEEWGLGHGTDDGETATVTDDDSVFDNYDIDTLGTALLYPPAATENAILYGGVVYPNTSLHRRLLATVKGATEGLTIDVDLVLYVRRVWV